MNRRFLAALALLAATAAPLAALAQTGPAPKTITWDALVPKDWDPTKPFRDAKLGTMVDGDPRSNEMLKRMRETWDNAPTNAEMDGANVRIPGYLVPLEETKGETREFLLVPYFGACIHSPPPPANQIIHVKMSKPAKGLKSMDAVWVSGTMKTFRGDTSMGVSGYQMSGLNVELYAAPSK